jgi:hypothetical protein
MSRWFNLALGIIGLKREAIREAAAADDLTLGAVVFVGISGIAGAAGIFDIFGIFYYPIVQLACFALLTGVLWFIARLFGGTGTYLAQFRAQGLTWILFWISIIPFGIGAVLSVVTFVWWLVVDVVITEEVHGLSRGKSIAAVLLPVGFCCIATAAVVAAVGFASILAILGLGALASQ